MDGTPAHAAGCLTLYSFRPLAGADRFEAALNND